MVATEAPTPGTMPTPTPMRPERTSSIFILLNIIWNRRKKAETLSRNPAFSKAICSCTPQVGASTMFSMLGREKVPSMTGMKGMPPMRSMLPKVKRGLPT